MANTDLSTPLQSLLLYTHNVARVLKPSQDGELAHAIHETLHYALDGDEQDYVTEEGEEAEAGTSSVPNTDSDSDVRQGFFPTGDPENPYISFDWDASRAALTLPHPATVLNPILRDPCTTGEDGSELREAFDVTAKFFFLNKPSAAATNGHSEAAPDFPVEWVEESLRHLKTATGLDSIDTMILAFPALKLDCNHANDEQVKAKAAKAAAVWRRLSPNDRINSLGLSDISRRSLQSVVEQLRLPACDPVSDAAAQKERAKAAVGEAMVSKGHAHMHNGLQASDGPIEIPSSPSQAAFNGGDRASGSGKLLHVYAPGPCRRPRLCSINLREQSCDDNSLGGASISNTNAGSNCWDRGLADYCKEQNIVLVAHSDQKDILPTRTLPTLLGEFEGRMPHAMKHDAHLEPVWCLKYTVLIRDRGVLADKGFVLFCRAVEGE